LIGGGTDGESTLAQAVVDVVGALIVVLDLEGRILLFNETCVRTTGWQPEEVLGQSFFDRLIPADQLADVRDAFARVRQGTLRGEYENDWLRKDGSRVRIAWRNTCTFRAGRAEYVIGTGVDVSQQRALESTIEAIIENTPNVAVQIFDRQGTITLWNPASARLYGWTKEETLGRRADETFLSPGTMAELLAAFESIDRDGRPVGPAPFSVRHKRGVEVLASSTVFAIPTTRDGGRFVCMDLDVTTSTRIQEALREAAALPSGDPAAVRKLTAQLARLLECRCVLTALVEPDRQRARTAALVIDGADAPPMAFPLLGSACAALDAGGGLRLERGARASFPADPLLARTGAEAAFGIAFGAGPDGPRGYLLALHDRELTPPPAKLALLDLFATRLSAELERQRAEQAILSAKAELELRVQERTAALAASNAELESFSYSVSHDLRAPLRAVTGLTQLLREDHGHLLPPDGVDLLRRIEAAGTRMSELIDDLLSLAQLTRRPIEPTAVDLSALARDVADELTIANRDRQVRVTIDPGLWVRADPGLLRVVFVNLLGNAWKFTRDRAEAHVRVHRETHEGQAWIAVSDDGAGFDPTYADRLFAPFQRLHSSREFPGTGIGLATVDRIIKRHGGRTRARGAPDQGATIAFTLPTLETR
jgi:PAS domain S-box-containing protein